MRSYSLFIVLAGLLFTACSKDSFEQLNDLSFIVLAEGSYSNLTMADHWIIKNDNAWQEFQSQSAIYEESFLSVNFDTHIVIALSYGEQATGGYRIFVEQIQEFADHLEVYVHKTSPGEGDEVTLAFTQAYQVIMIDKTDKEIQFIY